MARLRLDLSLLYPWEYLEHHSRNNFPKGFIFRHFVDFQVVLELLPFLRSELGSFLMQYDTLNVDNC